MFGATTVSGIINDLMSSSSKVNPAQVFAVEEKPDGKERESATGRRVAQTTLCSLYDLFSLKKINYLNSNNEIETIRDIYIWRYFNLPFT